MVKMSSVNSSSTSSSTIEMPDQHEIDTILDKISKSGYESLTKEEKQALKEDKRELKQAKKDKNGRILGLGILGVVVVVLLCVWIF